MRRYDIAALIRAAGSKRPSVAFPTVPARRGTERTYRSELRKMLRAIAKLVRERVLPMVPVEQQHLTSDANPVFDGVFRALRREVENTLVRSAERMVTQALSAEVQKNTAGLMAAAKSAWQIDLTGVVSDSDVEPHLEIALDRNIGLISSLADDALKFTRQAVVDGVLEGRSQRDIARELKERFGVLDSRARLIARDQTAKLVSDLNRIRQQQAGIEEYIWRTSRDERVRATHEAKANRRFSWDDPPSDTGHPGKDYQCRCTAEGVIDLFDDPEDEETGEAPKPKRRRKVKSSKERKTPRAVPKKATTADIPDTRNVMTSTDRRLRVETRRLGDETAAEHAIVVNTKGDEIGRSTSGEAREVRITGELSQHINNPNAKLVLHHNHPGYSSSFSPADMASFGASRGLQELWAHSQTVSYRARRTAKTHKIKSAYVRTEWRRQTLKIVDLDDGTLTNEDGNKIVAHMFAKTLAKRGYIEYDHTDLPDDMQRLLKKYDREK